MLFGNKNEFAIELENVDTTERYMLMKLYIQNVNILEYSFDGKVYSPVKSAIAVIVPVPPLASNVNVYLFSVHFA